MSPRPQLLFLCQTLPYPPDGGVWIRTFHVLRLLARTFDVTALCFERATPSSSSLGNGGAQEALKRLASVDVFSLPQRHSRLRFVWDHLRSAVRGRVYTQFVYHSRAFERRLGELVSSKTFNLVHADSLGDLFRYLPSCAGVPSVGVHHNVESQLLRKRGAIERPGLRRTYLNYQARLMEEVERRWCARVDLNVTVSSEDKALLHRIAPDARTTVVPNGVDLEEFRPMAAAQRGIVYMGGMNWLPNRDALDFFCAEILPHLGEAGTREPIRWIGAASEDQRRRYRQAHGVELTGYVDDVRPLANAAACHIVPLRVGGGTRLKILNAWAMGKAVVSTTIGCEGLAAIDADNILIRDEPRAFAEAVANVLRDSVLRRQLGESGRRTAERYYSWDVIGQRMIDSYLAVTGLPSEHAPALAHP